MGWRLPVVSSSHGPSGLDQASFSRGLPMASGHAPPISSGYQNGCHHSSVGTELSGLVGTSIPPSFGPGQRGPPRILK